MSRATAASTDGLIANLYESIFDPSMLDDFLQELAVRTESRAVHLIVHDARTGTILLNAAGGVVGSSPEELAAFVESQPVCCSHYDAFRFFTPAARPLNALQPTLETRPDLEQPACLHANMDLYKWASKLWPWTGSELIGECFELALAGRDLDMRASPYDLRDLGYEPARIETAEGRARYEKEQRDLAARAAVVRLSLRRCCESLVLIDHPPPDLLAKTDEGALWQV